MHEKKILIVDDDRGIAGELESLLRSEGFSDIEHAIDGIQGVRKSHRMKPDLILLDLQMPGGDGFSVLKKLKMAAPLANTPVIVITGVEDMVIKKKLLEEGIRTLFQKPFKTEDLLREIKAVLNSADRSVPSEA